jgi:GDP-D-mannose 3',5'-epimerase
MKKTALVLGAGGFIGSHMVTRLKQEGYWVRGVDLKRPEFSETDADHFVITNLADGRNMDEVVTWAGCNRDPYSSKAWARQFDLSFDEVYQFAADMGGAGYIFTGENDANIMTNSAQINLALLDSLVVQKGQTGRPFPKVFYSSSACIYPAYNQTDPDNPKCDEASAYPAEPDSEYGWEKLFSERLYAAYARNYQVPVRVARYHNIYGPRGTWRGGKEKAPAAICRKIIESEGAPIEIWGDGKQTRSFLYIDDCIDATRLLMQSDFEGPVNIGSEEMVTINELVQIVGRIDNHKGGHKYDLTKPQGVRGRNSDNTMIENMLGWEPKWVLEDGIGETYEWIWGQINK